jgi:hypothetical protein
VLEQAEQRHLQQADVTRRQRIKDPCRAPVEPLKRVVETSAALGEIDILRWQLCHQGAEYQLHLRTHGVPHEFLRIARQVVAQLLGPDDAQRCRRHLRQGEADVMSAEQRRVATSENRQLERRVATVGCRIGNRHIVDRLKFIADPEFLREHERHSGKQGAAAPDYPHRLGRPCFCIYAAHSNSSEHGIGDRHYVLSVLPYRPRGANV